MSLAASKRLQASIEQALGAPDDTCRLDLLLEAWRQVRASELADAIEAVSERLRAHQKPLGGRDHEQRQTRWMAALDEGGSERLGRLLLALVDISCDPATERLEALTRLEPDPRISGTLTKIVRQPPFRGLFAQRFWQLLWQLLETHADTRCLDALEEACDDAWISAFRPRMRPWMRDEVTRARRRIQAACRSVSGDLTPSVRARVVKSFELRRSEVAQLNQLLEEIVAEPDNDAPRLVYADILLEGGSPRGELITLQCRHHADRKASEEIEALLAKHLTEWVGPLSAAILTGSACFRRGFLTSCQLWAKSTREAATALGHREWGTVEHVRIASEPSHGPVGHRPLEVALHPALRNLRALEGLEPREARYICAITRPLPIARLGLLWQEGPATRLRRAFVETSALPHLTELVLATTSAEKAMILWYAQLCESLERVHRPVPSLVLELLNSRNIPAWRLQLNETAQRAIRVEPLGKRPSRRLLETALERIGVSVLEQGSKENG